jgi:hypothetical protein
MCWSQSRRREHHWGFDEVVHIHIAGFAGVHADENTGFLVDALGSKIQGGSLPPCPLMITSFLMPFLATLMPTS